jgi:hypothetical protein
MRTLVFITAILAVCAVANAAKADDRIRIDFYSEAQ